MNIILEISYKYTKLYHIFKQNKLYIYLDTFLTYIKLGHF